MTAATWGLRSSPRKVAPPLKSTSTRLRRRVSAWRRDRAQGSAGTRSFPNPWHRCTGRADPFRSPRIPSGRSRPERRLHRPRSAPAACRDRIARPGLERIESRDVAESEQVLPGLDAARVGTVVRGELSCSPVWGESSCQGLRLRGTDPVGVRKGLHRAARFRAEAAVRRDELQPTKCRERGANAERSSRVTESSPSSRSPDPDPETPPSMTISSCGTPSTAGVLRTNRPRADRCTPRTVSSSSTEPKTMRTLPAPSRVSGC